MWHNKCYIITIDRKRQCNMKYEPSPIDRYTFFICWFVYICYLNSNSLKKLRIENCSVKLMLIITSIFLPGFPIQTGLVGFVKRGIIKIKIKIIYFLQN